MEEDNVAIRLKYFIDYLQLSNSQFADNCGIPRPSLSQLLTGRNKKISDVIVGMIHRAYPQLSVVWLMFGEGEMLEKPNFSGDDSSENPANVSGDEGELKNGQENGLETYEKSSATRMNPGIPPHFGMSNSVAGKTKNSENPRKVVQITVYYDDNSYETFYPKK